MRKEKAANGSGYNQTTAKILKSVSERTVELINIFNKVMRTRQVAKYWLIDIITPIFK